MHKVASLIVSIYIAIVIYTNAFFIKVLTIGKGTDQLFWNHLAIFLIILVPVFFLVNKFVHIDSGGGLRKHGKMVLYTVVLIGLVTSLFYHVIPLNPIYDIPAPIDNFFASDTAFTIWLIVPLLALFI